MAQLQVAGLDAGTLLGLWRTRDTSPARWPVEAYRLLGEKLLPQGRPLLAYDVVRQGLQEFPEDVRLRQLQGLSLARSGAFERASAVLQQLVTEKHADGETLGMLARTYKDRAARAATPRDAKKFLRHAAATYAQAFRVGGGYWTGINAATMALLVGKKAESVALARQVRASCRRQLRAAIGDPYWLHATLGEAALLERDFAQAGDRYAQAVRVAGRRFGDLQASRRNARLLFDYWQEASSEIEELLGVPPVAVFAGHMIDEPQRPRPRFPARSEGEVAAAIRQRIAATGVATGYASAACGADLLFHEAMLAAGHEIFVVLPCRAHEFLAASVPSRTAAKWRARFARVVEKAARVVIASSDGLALDGVSYDYTNQMILGLARIRATQWETQVVPLAVWDKSPGDGPGGTASAIGRWRDLELPIEIIDLRSIVGQRPLPFTARKKKGRLPGRKKSSRSFGSQIRAMLFAVGFSKLNEDELPRFVRHFLGSIGELIERAAGEIITRNTWGDGLYLVFCDVPAAAHFALALAERISRTDWRTHGLPAGLSLRIGVHAGPVYACIDPIKQSRDFFGAHVSRAARIEPITPPGHVYASEAFAALAAAQGVADLSFEYAGQVPMPKSYGTYPMYHVTRQTDASGPVGFTG